MRIALDARTIYRPTRRGTGKNLIDLYRHLAVVRPDWQILAYHRQQEAVERLLPSQTVQPQLIEMFGDRIDAWQRWRLPAAAWQDCADVLHCPANHCPTWMPTRTVVTIHDLIPLDITEGQPSAAAHRFEKSVRTACRQASWIICPSQYTRDRLVSEFHADPARITVNPWAPDSSVQPVPQSQWGPVLDRYGVHMPFVLHFGAAEPRKNTRRLIEAWAMCDRQLNRHWQLLIVGLDNLTQNELAEMTKQLGVEQSVHLNDFADEADLPTLLSATQFLAYPSLSEGFGLPILDAWAAGTAVLTSNCTSLPEVVENAAVLVDPLNSCSVAHGLTQMMSDARLRNDLAQRGAIRLKHYSWHDTAQRFAQAMESAVGSRQTLRAAA